MFPGFFRSVVAYAIWSIVPDYFNLLKTRKVLGLITARQMGQVDWNHVVSNFGFDPLPN